MNSSVSFLLVMICAVVLAAQQGQAKKGCNAYGHACYGGHGKRSLGSLTDEMRVNNAFRNEREELHPDEQLQVMPNEATGLLPEGEIETFPRYRLIKIMKSLLSGHLKRPVEQPNEIDYPISAEAFSRDNSNVFN
ncbi:neuropeptide CCHamide-2 [Anastrepha ludens]|uniref:neuropeptide CCHamide-2 n=1 Tax=Anastrepha ludens TaxID=28586 RepID=UPI0023AE7DB2|nr:neuropeptide CCHamide-2 [Anastrepha ludens]XP_053945352.1 neuropeptide CCHamide-2 [Anastrepha ludens]